MVKHIAQLAEWQKTKLFDYSGRGQSAEPRFQNGECGIFIGSSATRADIKANSKFEIGYGMMPYWPDVKGAPQNSIIGGATLWVLRDRPREEYKGVARFFAYLSQPGVQAAWHQNTGYLPITRAAFELTRAQGFYERTPGSAISFEEITLHPPTENSKGIRLGSFNLIRGTIEEELEQAFAGQKSAQAALDAAVERGNKLLAPVRARQPGPVADVAIRSTAAASDGGRAAGQGVSASGTVPRRRDPTRRFAPTSPASGKQMTELKLPAFADAKTFRAWRSDPPQWLPIALDIARGHGIDTSAPHVFSTGTNLVVGLGEKLILKIFPPLLRAQFVSERGSLMQLAGRLHLPIPEIVAEGERDGWPYLDHHAPRRHARLGGVAATCRSAEGARAAPDRRDHCRRAARAARPARANRAALERLHAHADAGLP